MNGLIRLTICLGIGAAALNAVAGPESLPASGKEMKEVAPMPPEPCSWTGFYVGGHIGYGWMDPDANLDPQPHDQFLAAQPTNLDINPSGVVGGGQVGYNYQMGHLVVGAEADFTGADMDDSGTSSSTNSFVERAYYYSQEKIDWFGTARLRLGYAPSCRFLFYATGGLAYGNADYSGNLSFEGSDTTYPISFDQIKVGWAAGAGAEFSLNRHWSIKAEYLFIDLGDKCGAAPVAPTPVPPFRVDYHWETEIHTFDVGLNYRF